MKTLLCVLVIFNIIYTITANDRCTTPKGENGICKDINECWSLFDIFQNTNSSLDVTDYIKESYCKNSADNKLVCCPMRRSKRYSRPRLNEYCGISGSPYLKKVVNGSPAPLGAWPWMAALGYKSHTGGIAWHCGGTLITRRHVITAAHCIHGHERTLSIVRLGDLNLNKDRDDGAHPEDFPIRLMMQHEEFDSTSQENDIGLLKLAHDVRFSRLLRPICLPISPSLRRNTYEHTLPFVVGWGDTTFDGDKASHLQQVQIPVVPNEKCKEEYENIDNIIVNYKSICAGYDRGGKDSCQGDSGGPLMYPSLPPGQSNIHFYLIGIVSNGYKCAVAGYAGIYTRVTEFIPWIESHINY